MIVASFDKTQNRTAAVSGAGSANGGGTALESGNTSYNGSASSVYEFEDTSFTRLGGGGGGATSSGWYGTGGAPYGSRGGGEGKWSASANTGAGGGGGRAASNGTGGPGGDGGSGIVCIRNTEVTELPVRFNGRTPTQIFFNGALVEHLVVDGTEIFMERMRGWLGWLKRQTRFALRAA